MTAPACKTCGFGRFEHPRIYCTEFQGPVFTLDEAINRAQFVAAESTSFKAEHEMFAKWLVELRDRRNRG